MPRIAVFSLLVLILVVSIDSYVPVYVMLPLNTVNNDGSFNGNIPWDNWLQQLKSIGVDGVMGDVWWGAVEKQPKQYDWSAYSQLMRYVTKYQLKFQAVMSFHQCGGNVGDDCDIYLPTFVRNVGNANPDVYYTDQHGNRDTEYLSLGVDNMAIFAGRSPVQMYRDFTAAFVSQFSSIVPSVINELQISLGPAGELRYPSYQLSHWSFPGAGEFQCYDKYMLANLSASASSVGHPEWGHGGPNNAGSYNCNPCTGDSACPFYSNGFDNFASAYGQFFLNWYSGQLIAHGDRVLGAIRSGLSVNVDIAAKVSGVHWQHQTPSHSAELTAGYKNDQGKAYQPIAQMFAAHNVKFDFTCFEMRDNEQPSNACSGPEELIYDTKTSADSAGVKYQGENALNRYDQSAYDQIKYESHRFGDIDGFTYLRLGSDLFAGNNFQTFANFVRDMHNM